MHVLLREQYSCGGVLVFCLQWEIVFSVLHILSVQYSCAVVSVLRIVLLCQFLVLAITTGKKIVLVIWLAGCAVVSVFGSGGKQAIFLLWRESFITTRKKKVLVVCLAGCAVVSVFGSGDYYHQKKKF